MLSNQHHIFKIFSSTLFLIISSISNAESISLKPIGSGSVVQSNQRFYVEYEVIDTQSTSQFIYLDNKLVQTRTFPITVNDTTYETSNGNWRISHPGLAAGEINQIKICIDGNIRCSYVTAFL